MYPNPKTQFRAPPRFDASTTAISVHFQCFQICAAICNFHLPIPFTTVILTMYNLQKDRLISPAMRYTATPSTFPVAYWRELWENNISNIEQLRALASTTGIVAIDMDPYVLEGKTTHDITEFGIAFLPPTASNTRPCIPSPPSLDALVQHFSIQSCSLRVADRIRNDRRRETYRYGSGEPRIVPADQIENAALSVIRSFTSGAGPKPILVGYATAYELGTLTKFYPRLLTEGFSAWVDMQEIALEISPVTQKGCAPPTGKRDLLPGMRDVLLALGYQQDGIAVMGFKNSHNAGNDAVRVLAVLLGLLALPIPMDPTAGPVLAIEHCGQKFQKTVDSRSGLMLRKYWTSKPRPAELFPYMARIESGGMPLPERFRTFEYFAEYEPVAAGRAKETNVICYYLCLPTLEALERFIAEVDGQPSKDFRGVVWSVTLAHDTPVMPFTGWKEFAERRRRGQYSEEAQVIRLQRGKKAAENNLDELFEALSFGGDDLEER